MRIFKWLSILLAVSLNSHAQTFVQIKFGGEDNRNSKKHFTIPLENGSFFLGNTIKAQANEEGIIDLKLNLKNPGIIIFSNSDIDIIEVYVEPDKRVRVNVDGQVTFSGALAVENALLRSFRRNRVAHALDQKYLPQQVVTLRKSSTTKEFLDSLDNFIARDQQKIDQAVKNEKKISPQFIDFITKDVRIYYYDIGIAALGNKFNDYLYKTDEKMDSITGSAWGNLYSKLMSQEWITDNLRISQWYFAYLYDYVFRYKYSFLKERAKTSITFESPNSHMLHNYFVGRIPSIVNDYLDTHAKESFIPNYLAYYLYGGSVFYFSEEMLDYFEKFRIEFPNSAYLKYIDQKMDNVREYVKPSGGNENYSPKMIENYERINTFEELINPFQGNVVFIDIWATWCGPCVEEFNHYKKLRDLESSRKDFRIIFFSRDKPTEKARWVKFIEKKKLSGYHILPNDDLEKDLRRLVNWKEIPRYIIVNREGKIVNDNAPPPSDGDSLIRELTKYLKY